MIRREMDEDEKRGGNSRGEEKRLESRMGEKGARRGDRRKK